MLGSILSTGTYSVVGLVEDVRLNILALLGHLDVRLNVLGHVDVS